MTSFSSPLEETVVLSMAPELAMFCGSSKGVLDLPYKLDGPAIDTLRTLGSLELGRRWESAPPLCARGWGPLAAEHPSTPWSFISISALPEHPIPLSWDSTSVLSKRGVVSRVWKSDVEYSPPYA